MVKNRIYSLDSETAQGFCHFLVSSGYRINVMAGDNDGIIEYEMTITDSYDNEVFYYVSSSPTALDMIIRECTNSYLATNDGLEMYSIWESQ